jgi:hypothetical protein
MKRAALVLGILILLLTGCGQMIRDEIDRADLRDFCHNKCLSGSVEEYRACKEACINARGYGRKSPSRQESEQQDRERMKPFLDKMPPLIK